MKVTTFGKAGLSLATAVTLSIGLGVTAANASGSPLTASQEDPTTGTYLSGAGIGQYTLVGTGSDTIQDVEYGIAQDLGTYTDSTGTYANIASWTATGTTAMSYRSGGHPAVATAHPNGSGAGFTTLKESIGVVAPGVVDGVAAGDVDYSRASGFQGNEQLNQTGVVTEIPFAVDAISFAAPAGSPFLKTNGSAGLTLADLANIYAGVDKYVDTGTGALSATATGTTEPIQAFLPKPGSGSRQFFLQQLNKVNSAVLIGSDKGDTEYPATYSGTTSPYVGSQMPDGTTQVQEHDASVLSAAPAGVAAIAPFSAAKFIGYHNGVIADPSGKVAGTDYVLVPFDSASGAVLPYTGDASTSATLAPNVAYKTQGVEGTAKVTREVFNIIPTEAVKHPNANLKYRALYDTFVGPYSKFCADSATIQAYGFLADTNCGNSTRTANAGGSDTSNGYSTSTVTVSNLPAAVAGKSTVVTASVQQTSPGGGSVTITVNGHAYTGTIPAGQTSVGFTVPTPTAGSIAYGGGANDGFTPNLAGVAASPIPAGTISVAKATPTVKATAAKVSHLKIGSAVVTVTASGLVPTGTVNVRVYTTGHVLKASVTKSLSGGKATVSFGKVLPKGTYYVYVSYAGNANVNAKALTKLATLTVY